MCFLAQLNPRGMAPLSISIFGDFMHSFYFSRETNLHCPMPNSYTQIHPQFVFAVKYRLAVIDSSWKADLYKYIPVLYNKTDTNYWLLTAWRTISIFWWGCGPHNRYRICCRISRVPRPNGSTTTNIRPENLSGRRVMVLFRTVNRMYRM